MVPPTEPPRRLRVAAAAAALGVVVALVLWGFADARLSHGWSARWYAPVDGMREEITRTTEHRVRFPNVHRPLSRYIQGWPFDRFARPTGLPAIDAELRAVITVPDTSRGFLVADAAESTELYVDGERADALHAPGAAHARHLRPPGAR